MVFIVIQNGGLHVAGRYQAGNREHQLQRPCPPRNAARALIQLAIRLDGDIQRAVRGQRDQSDQAGKDGVPVENSGVSADAKICPKRFKEIAIGSQRNAAHYIPQGGAEKDCKQNAGRAENQIEEADPDRMFQVAAHFDADSAQHQEPQDHHQGKIEAAEAGGIKQRKGEVQRATGGDQPDFIAIPHRTDGTQDLAALIAGLARAQINRARSQVEAVEHCVGRNHQGHHHEP